MTWLVSILTLIGIFGILSVSLGLITGHLGTFSMAHAALFGVGAYTYAYLTVHHGINWVVAVIAAMVVAALAGGVMAVPSLRVSGDYFLVASFALQVVASSIFENWTPVTGGTAGVPGILRPMAGGLDFTSDAGFLLLVAIATALVTALAWFVVRSPYGRMMHVVRDDVTVAATMGKPIALTKVSMTMLSGAMAGLAGALYGQYLMYISPSSFDVHVSVTIITMIVIGGMTSVPGNIVGAALILLVPEGLRYLQMPPDVAGPAQQVLFGVLIVVLMFLRPEGLFGERLSTMGRRRKREIAIDSVEPEEAAHVA